MKKIVCFVSTGRCGTQWLAKILGKVYTDLTVVTHEPLGPRYRPKEFLRAYDRISELCSIPEVENHLSWIKGILDEKLYIETGWPCFAAIPLFYKFFKGKIRLIHLVRHPVNTALSLTTHKFHSPERPNDNLAKFALLDPFDPGIVQKWYQNRWDTMTQYEKCLFQWTEINLYALELRKRFEDVPFLMMKMEDMMNPRSGALNLFVNFIGLPFRSALIESHGTRVDSFRSSTDIFVDWRQIFDHPKTVALSKEFGYELDNIDSHRLNQRYRKSFWSKICGTLGELIR